MGMKNKTVMSWNLGKKKECINVYFVGSNFFLRLGFISMYSVLNNFSEYIYFYVPKKRYFTYICCLFFKIVESLQRIFNLLFWFCYRWLRKIKELLYCIYLFLFDYVCIKVLKKKNVLIGVLQSLLLLLSVLFLVTKCFVSC